MAKSKKQKKKNKLQKKRQQVVHKKKIKPKSLGRYVSHATGASISPQELAQVSTYSVYECLIGDTWEKEGLAFILLARKASSQFIAATYLVDIRCLGVKSTNLFIANTQAEYEAYKEELENCFVDSFDLIECSYTLANSIIYGGVAYAKQFGLEPEKGFVVVKNVLGKPVETPELVQFGGEDGKPLYINGPNDDAEMIVNKLTKAVGRDGFHFILGNPLI